MKKTLLPLKSYVEKPISNRDDDDEEAEIVEAIVRKYEYMQNVLNDNVDLRVVRMWPAKNGSKHETLMCLPT
ncbi:hypothetical protein SK128_009099, partial [Halocaridina rubra]